MRALLAPLEEALELVVVRQALRDDLDTSVAAAWQSVCHAVVTELRRALGEPQRQLAPAGDGDREV